MKNNKKNNKPRKMTDEERKVMEEFKKHITNYENNYEAVMELDKKLQKVRYVENTINSINLSMRFKK